MKKTAKVMDFAGHLTTFLAQYLPGQRGLSEDTILSYRDTFTQLLTFTEEKHGIKPEKMGLSDMTGELVEEFLTWIETERRCSISTRNQRLAAVRSFVNYLKKRRPEHLREWQLILDIKTKKHPEPKLPYLAPDEVGSILSKPDLSDKFGRRDVTLLALLYDAGARVSEICNLRVRDIRLQKPRTATLTGKGSKTRVVPIMKETAARIEKHIKENKLTGPESLDSPLFTNHMNTRLTRGGVTYILKKYAAKAIPETKVSPHIIRHSKAMHMLKSGTNLVYIRDFLGHEKVETTETYAKADPETKRVALDAAAIPMENDLPDWSEDDSLMAMLKSLG